MNKCQYRKTLCSTRKICTKQPKKNEIKLIPGIRKNYSLLASYSPRSSCGFSVCANSATLLKPPKHDSPFKQGTHSSDQMQRTYLRLSLIAGLFIFILHT